jgi:hypothetical protein
MSLLKAQQTIFLFKFLKDKRTKKTKAKEQKVKEIILSILNYGS